MELRSDDRLLELFDGAQRSAFHLEVRDSYAEPAESEPLRRFLAGEPEPPDGYDKSDWIELIEALTNRGVAMSRIRVVSQPLSGYQQWLLSVAGSSVSAGEDIRYVPRHLADEVPPDDWWLFDDEVVAFNLVDASGKPAGAAVTIDPGVAAYCQSIRKRLWDLAIPYTEFASSVSTRQ